jgi:glycerol-3-phosphate dehydrogenase
VQHAVVMTVPKDGRLIFAIPWTDPESAAASRTVIGTTDTDYHGDPDRVAADAADIDYLLEAANYYFPDTKLQPADVLSTWAGLRPLVMPHSDGLDASSVSREHRILSRPGLVTIIGGKLTTYRRMAAQLLSEAYKQLGDHRAAVCDPRPSAAWRHRCEATDRRLRSNCRADRGAVRQRPARHRPSGGPAPRQHLRWPRAPDPRPDPASGDPTATERLDPELPFIYAEVDQAVLADLAIRLDDVLSRRLPLLLLSRDQGLPCAEKVAQRIAKLLDWSPERTERELTHYRDVVGLSRQFRSVPSGK